MQPQIQAVKECKNCGRNFYTSDDFLAHTSRWRICTSEHLWFNCSCNSTQIIIKGRFEWYDPKNQLSSAARSIFNLLPNIQPIPRLPTKVMELLQLLVDPNVSSGALANAAKHDSFLAARILRIAENHLIKEQTKLKSLAHAISLIGHAQLKELALIAAISCVEPKTQIFKLDLFWEHSLTIGRIAEYLNHRFKNYYVGDEAYIVGSVCNLGKLVLALSRPDLADQFQLEIDNVNRLGTWIDAEQRQGGFQHTVLGEIGACIWGLSHSAIECMQQHHMVANAREKPQPQLFELIGLANQFAHWIWLEPHRMDTGLFQGLLRRFELTPAEADLLAQEMMHLAVRVL